MNQFPTPINFQTIQRNKAKDESFFALFKNDQVLNKQNLPKVRQRMKDNEIKKTFFKHETPLINRDQTFLFPLSDKYGESKYKQQTKFINTKLVYSRKNFKNDIINPELNIRKIESRENHQTTNNQFEQSIQNVKNGITLSMHPEFITFKKGFQIRCDETRKIQLKEIKTRVKLDRLNDLDSRKDDLREFDMESTSNTNVCIRNNTQSRRYDNKINLNNTLNNFNSSTPKPRSNSRKVESKIDGIRTQYNNLFRKELKDNKKNYKTFSIDEKFTTLIQEFELRGWRNLSEKEGSDYKFDFSQRLGNFNSNAQNQINSDQIISSFRGMNLTSKNGMMRLLKKATKQGITDSSTFFPKAQDMTQKQDLDQFFKFHICNICFQKMINFALKQDIDLNSEMNIDADDFLMKHKLDLAKTSFKALQFVSTVVDNQFIKGTPCQDEPVLIRTILHYFSEQDFTSFTLKQFDRNKKTIMSKSPIKPSIISQVTTLRQQFKVIKEAFGSPQLSLNQGANKWIVKPHNASRGIGIQTKAGLNNIVTFLAERQGKCIIQKYIERPLTYQSRKFDIRIWSCLTSISPLISWTQQKFQVRLSSKEQNLADDDRQVNLTNQAVQKDSDAKTDECMLRQEQFAHFLAIRQGHNALQRVQTRITEIIDEVTLAGKDNMEARANTFQVLGWDFMVDWDLKVWLIECNRSPDLMPTTSVTKELTDELFSDIAKMFCDHEYKDVNFSDELTNIGSFKKTIDQQKQREQCARVRKLSETDQRKNSNVNNHESDSRTPDKIFK